MAVLFSARRPGARRGPERAGARPYHASARKGSDDLSSHALSFEKFFPRGSEGREVKFSTH